MPTRRAAGLAICALAVAACGSDPESTPAACLNEADAYLEALEQAPGQALVGGEAPIRDCLVTDQPAGQLNTVGASLVEAATLLNERARERPAGEATTQLGYLVGAVEEGASRTGGTHADLVIRVNSAARFNAGGEPLPAAFERAFGVGYAAAREDG